jgi:uncharacterized membrane protein YhaH (DUF805 family)
VTGFHISFDWPGIALAILGAVVAFLFRRRYHRRAMAKDHVAEVSRDVAIPWECANCGSPDAPFRFAVESKIMLRMISTTPPFFEMSKTFFFHFCLRCSRVLRRRRRFGTLVILAGVCVLLFIPVSLVLVSVSVAVNRLINAGPSDWYLLLLICAVLAGPLVFATGMTIYDSAPPLSIVDAGGDTIFFKFRNQQFRDLFARLNGED